MSYSFLSNYCNRDPLLHYKTLHFTRFIELADGHIQLCRISHTGFDKNVFKTYDRFTYT